jgi:hypothetical protein
MNDYQMRVIKEKAELEVKIKALETFIEKNPVFSTLPKEERGLLQSQLDVMLGYAGILESRIELFGEKK